ncbi:ATP-binding protein [Jiella marina]|uniref:ATP-binding protein n=1 Tax=Jiella sp. LLJ827 TaxID=2917712 RepID=UPI0021010BA1|nr:ATP-binding protein [Jiella sp. LLJ827]MCQ0988204.1 ATP-binding protein [Jiella sp. LLJ827]
MAKIQDREADELMDTAWIDVIRRMDETYSDLVAYQIELEEKNADLESMRQFMESVLGAMTDILIVCDQTGVVIEVNPALSRQTGEPASTLVGKCAEAVFSAEARDGLAAMLQTIARGRKPKPAELSVIGGQEPAPFEFHGTPRLDARGRVVGAVLIGRPVGELRRAYSSLAETHEQLKAAQAQVVNSEKMASLGRLVAGVAHELNNPISFVYGNAHALERYIARLETYFDRLWSGASREELIALRKELKLDRAISRIREAVSGSLEGAERVRDIVEELRRFSADGKGKSEPFDLVQTVTTAVGWVVKGRSKEIDVSIDAPDPITALGRSGPIQQVVMNVVQNALDAMEEMETPALSVTIQRTDEGEALVRIADRGPGIAPDALQHLFEPFFTTKPVGKGTGLGLSLSYKFVEEHGGRLVAENLPEGGAAFSFRLPTVDVGEDTCRD